jgi:hypothetical protein
MDRAVLQRSELILDLVEILGHKVDVNTVWRPSPLAANNVRDAIPL